MYLFDFIKQMTRKSNIPVFIYLALNIVIITLFVNIGWDVPMIESMGLGIILYVISLTVTLSPIGEWILRLQTGCRTIKRKEQINFLEPIFREVYNKARKLDPSIPRDVRLFINSDESPNAFATGRKTICVTEGLLHMPEEQIKATLGHEFGHLAHKDTDLILVVTVGNMIVSSIIVMIQLIIELFHLVMEIISFFIGGKGGAIASIINSLYRLMITKIVVGLTWIWTKIGILLVMKSCRSNEFEADEFSFNLGYGNEMCALLDTIGNADAKGLFANLASSHPNKNDRIAKLQELGASYRTVYGTK